MKYLTTILLCLFLLAGTAKAENQYIDFWAGASEILDSGSLGSNPGSLGFEISRGWKTLQLNHNHSVMTYLKLGVEGAAGYLYPSLGVRFALNIQDCFEISVSTAVGHFWHLSHLWIEGNMVMAIKEKSQFPDLSTGIMFREDLQLSFRLYKPVHLIIGLAHLSNAGLGDTNPATETLYTGLRLKF